MRKADGWEQVPETRGGLASGHVGFASQGGEVDETDAMGNWVSVGELAASVVDGLRRQRQTPASGASQFQSFSDCLQRIEEKAR